MVALRLKLDNVMNLPDGGPTYLNVEGRRSVDIGRNTYLDWTLPDPARVVSGRHCEIHYRDGGYWLTDISTNGTYLNGSDTRLTEPTRLRTGDRIAIGDYLINVVVEEDDAAPARTVEAPPTGPAELASGALWDVPTDRAAPAERSSERKARVAKPVHADVLDWISDLPTPETGASPAATPIPAPVPEGDPWAAPAAQRASRIETVEEGDAAMHRSVEAAAMAPAPAPTTDAAREPGSERGPSAPEMAQPEPEMAPGRSEPEEESRPERAAFEAAAHNEPQRPELLAEARREPEDPTPGATESTEDDDAWNAGPAEEPEDAARAEVPEAVSAAADEAPASEDAMWDAPPSEADHREPPAPHRPATDDAAEPHRADDVAQPHPVDAAPHQTDPAAQAPRPAEFASSPADFAPRPADVAAPLPAEVAPPRHVSPPEERGFGPAVRASEPQAPAPVTHGAEFERFVAALANALDVPRDRLDARSPEELAERVGAFVNLTIGGMQRLLKARAASRGYMRSGPGTQVQALGNNPLKFMPTPGAAADVLFGPRSRSYLGIEETLDESFADLGAHQMALYSAMQGAVERMLKDLEPAAIEEGQGEEKGFALPGSKKSKFWDTYKERYNARASQHDNGMVDVFMLCFADAYARAIDNRD